MNIRTQSTENFNSHEVNYFAAMLVDAIKSIPRETLEKFYAIDPDIWRIDNICHRLENALLVQQGLKIYNNPIATQKNRGFIV